MRFLIRARKQETSKEFFPTSAYAYVNIEEADVIYLDNAATGFPKPRSVIEEQTRCMRFYCGNAGRGSHALSLAASKKIFECRTEAAGLFGSDSPENVVFTMNTTMALNTVIKGNLRQGDHVLLSDMEHNAVLRPIIKLARAGIISYDIFPTFALDRFREDAQICRTIERLIKPKTKMLIASHTSNVCSAALPLEEIGKLCRSRGILFVVDAAQSAGHLPIDVERMKIDALCVPGHKGLLGPQGCGILLLGDAAIGETLIEGGSGYHSLEETMPEELPERFEAGTLPTPAIAGLCEGIREVKRMGVDAIGAHERRLIAQLYERFADDSRITVYAPHHAGAVLLFNVNDMPAEQVGNLLDRRGICVRAGYHCSALGHRTLKTSQGGAVRVSVGYANTSAHIDQLAKAIAEICDGRMQDSRLE